MENKTAQDKLDEQIAKEALKDIKEAKKVSYIASFPHLVDIVENEDGQFEFLIFDPVTKETSCVSVVEIEGKTYEPPPRNSLPKNLFFPNKEKVLDFIDQRKRGNHIQIEQTITNNNKVSDDSDVSDDSENLTMYKKKNNNSGPLKKTLNYNKDSFFYSEWDIDLYEKIVNYFQERAELPDEKLYDLLTLWIFHTYTTERADFSPIIYFLGLPEKGKSRMLKSMTYIARRGIRKISLTDAQILRDCTHLDATLALDMMDLWKKVEASGSEDVFLNRPERGIDVSRVNRPEKGAFQDTDYYTVFGPTIFATNELINEILNTRAIPIVMIQSRKEFAKKVKPQDGMILKEMLTAWRACTMGDIWPEMGRIAGSRLGDITQPLYQIVKVIHPAREEAFREVIHEIEIRRIKEKADSISGQILQAAIKVVSEVSHGYLKSQTIANEFNNDKRDREQMSSRKILNKLKTMGFEQTNAGDGSAAVFWNEELVLSLINEFGLSLMKNNGALSESSKSSETSETSETPNVQRPIVYE